MLYFIYLKVKYINWSLQCFKEDPPFQQRFAVDGWYLGQNCQVRFKGDLNISVIILPTNDIRSGYTGISRWVGSWSVSEILCLKLFLQFLSHLNFCEAKTGFQSHGPFSKFLQIHTSLFPVTKRKQGVYTSHSLIALVSKSYCER